MITENSGSQSTPTPQPQKTEIKNEAKKASAPVQNQYRMSIEEKTAILEQLRRSDLSDATRNALMKMLNQ